MHQATSRASLTPTTIVVGLVVTVTALAYPLASSVPSLTNHVQGGRESATAAHGSITVADGALPDGATVFDDRYPGITNLDPGLLRALRDAATDAAALGIELHVNSGWRSADYQNDLLRAAVSEYGSETAAARWVATSDTSAHVSGNAVDVGPPGATSWLTQHGSQYGLCQIYRNESWHYELRPAAVDRGCPAMYADAAHDPRMQD